MSPKLFIEVDAYDEPPVKIGRYWVTLMDEGDDFKGWAKFDGQDWSHGFHHSAIVTHWLRPIQQQEGFSREDMDKAIKEAWETGWQVRHLSCGLSKAEILKKKHENWHDYKALLLKYKK